jgi:hypothetical protein
MNERRPSAVLSLVACVGLLVGGCGAAAGSSPPTPASSQAPPVPSFSETASLPPSYGATPEPTPTTAASASPESPSPPDPTPTPPPDGRLSVEGGDPVVGELGSWSWLNAGSDAPWLPGNPIHVGAGEQLTFRMAKPVGIANWQVRRVPPSSVPGDDGVVGMAEGSAGPIAFAAPPRGKWSVAVDVLFADNRGGAVYYWAVTVD